MWDSTLLPRVVSCHTDREKVTLQSVATSVGHGGRMLHSAMSSVERGEDNGGREAYTGTQVRVVPLIQCEAASGRLYCDIWGEGWGWRRQRTGVKPPSSPVNRSQQNPSTMYARVCVIFMDCTVDT